MSVARVERFEPSRTQLLVAGAVLAELLLLVGYVGVTGTTITGPRYVLYPFVWITVGLWAVLRTTPRAAPGRTRLLAGVVAGGYFLVLAWLTGLVGIPVGPHAAAHAHIEGWQVTMSAPGWGPRVGYALDGWHLYFVPFRVVGYVALAYLVYATLLDVSARTLSGVLGLASCVSCAFPLVAPVVVGVLGGSAGMTTAVYGLSFDISTLAFLLAVGLLTYQTGR